MYLARGDWFFIILIFLDCIFMVRPYIYAIQQDNYHLVEVLKSRRLKFVYAIDILTVTVFLLIWTLLYFLQARVFWGFATAMFFFITEFALYFMEDLPDKKKPLRYTKRAVRSMLFVSVVATTFVSLIMAVVNTQLSDVYLRYLIFFAFPIVYPFIFLLSMTVVNVFERLNNLRYETRTKRILAKNKELIKIAITGSFGKTSVKNILDAMLSTQYVVLSTPASFNTPMGISKTVNQLDATHEIFIAEMGARHVGDIRRLMNIVKPKYSILTGANSQHLATFKSTENILREKSLVVSMLGADGFAVVNENLRDRLGEKTWKKLRRMPIYAGFGDLAEVQISDVSVGAEGSDFCMNIDGVSYSAATPMLGLHNIENIAMATAMAYGIGVSIEHILQAISLLTPTPHRMQLIEGVGIKIIDDSFNSNPDGARRSLEVLGMFDGRKVVVTPGLVELGKIEMEENFKLGQNLCAVADAVLLIGKKRTEPILRGLTENNFQGEVLIYNSLGEAEADFPRVLHLNDILLLLNDLPDCYDE